MARALAAVLNLLDPDVIVLGGGMSQRRRGSTRACRASGRRGRSRTAITTPLRPPLHGDSSGVRGAAWLWGRDLA